MPNLTATGCKAYRPLYLYIYLSNAVFTQCEQLKNGKMHWFRADIVNIFILKALMNCKMHSTIFQSRFQIDKTEKDLGLTKVLYSLHLIVLQGLPIFCPLSSLKLVHEMISDFFSYFPIPIHDWPSRILHNFVANITKGGDNILLVSDQKCWFLFPLLFWEATFSPRFGHNNIPMSDQSNILKELQKVHPIILIKKIGIWRGVQQEAQLCNKSTLKWDFLESRASGTNCDWHLISNITLLSECKMSSTVLLPWKT